MNQIALPSGGWMKFAAFGGKVVERADGACPECALFRTAGVVRPRCEHHFVERSAFGLKIVDAPKKYAALLDSYKQAINVQRVAPLNPEFSFYRVMGVHGDWPNTNGDLFRWGSRGNPDEPELLRLMKDAAGKPVRMGQNERYVYQTFIGKGNYKDHNNSKVADAVGIILDAVPNHTVKGIELLIAVDRSKDPMLVRGIDSGYITDVSMGAVHPDSMILLPSGEMISAKNMIPGIEVVTHRGRPRVVRAVQISQIEGTVVRIKAEGLPETVFTGDHPIWSISAQHRSEQTLWRGRMAHQRRLENKVESGWERRRQRTALLEPRRIEAQFVPAAEIKVGDYVGIPFPTEVKTSTFASRDFARLLGYYISEGWIITQDGKMSGIGFALNINEGKIADEIVGLCDKVLGKKPAVRLCEERSGMYLEVHDRLWPKVFCEHAGRGAKTKVLSNEVMLWDPALQIEILGTMINGDGCQVKSTGITCYSTASEALSRQVQTLASRCGIVSNVQKIEHGPSTIVNKETVEWQVVIGKAFSAILSRVSKIMSIPVQRESNTKFIEDGCLWTPIREKEIVSYSGPVVDLQVDGDESFVANHMAVHNCRVAYSICSVCANVAHNELEYCAHIKNWKGQAYSGPETGWKNANVHEDNRGVEFIEESWVTVGADTKAKHLEKIAALRAAKGRARLAEILVEAESELNKNSLCDWNRVNELLDMGIAQAILV